VGVDKLVDELCKYPGCRCGAQRRAWEGLSASPADYHGRWRRLDELKGDEEGTATVPESDSYPHVTCGWRSQSLRPREASRSLLLR
jgi:hypothetical protein